MARFSFAVALAVALTGCSTVQIDTQYKRDVDFGKYRAFAWNPVEPGPEQSQEARNPAIRQFVLGTIELQLSARGFQLAAPGTTPDFLIAVHGWSRDRIEVRQYGYAYGYGPYGMYPMMAGPAVEVRRYKEGTIVVDFIDAGTKELFWRGTASDTFMPGTGPDSIKEAIATLLAAYPPPKK
jgi:Domain of unknown function (DUF4136)